MLSHDFLHTEFTILPLVLEKGDLEAGNRIMTLTEISKHFCPCRPDVFFLSISPPHIFLQSPRCIFEHACFFDRSFLFGAESMTCYFFPLFLLYLLPQLTVPGDKSSHFLLNLLFSMELLPTNYVTYAHIFNLFGRLKLL